MARMSLSSVPDRSSLSAFARFFPENIRTIAVVAPASPAADSDAATRFLSELSQTGIEVRVMPNTRVGEPGGAYSSIDVSLRASDLEKAWLDPDVQLILPVRGGGGGRELLEALDWELLRRRPGMMVLGFSDLTLLHSAMLAKHCGRPVATTTLMGIPSATADSIDSCRRALAGMASPPYALTSLRTGFARGLVFGAHLQRLASLVGSPYLADLTGRVVFLECPHRMENQISELFQVLVDAGVFRKAAAIVFGQFPDCSSDEAVRAMLENLSTRVECPVFAGFPFGHTSRLHALDSSATAVIDASGVLRIMPGPLVDA